MYRIIVKIKMKKADVVNALVVDQNGALYQKTSPPTPHTQKKPI